VTNFKISPSSGQATFADVGFLPGVFGPVIIFNAHPIDSSIAKRALACLLSVRKADVSSPCTVLAFAQRSRPSGVLGPVDLPP